MSALLPGWRLVPGRPVCRDVQKLPLGEAAPPATSRGLLTLGIRPVSREGCRTSCTCGLAGKAPLLEGSLETQGPALVGASVSEAR